jgi:hypothetical protein
MTTTADRPAGRQRFLSRALEEAHRSGVHAASAGMQDAALGGLRLTGSSVDTLAEAAVSSATPFLRAPLLARISAVLLMHPVASNEGDCPTCHETVPCATSRTLQW